jgi:hypothetical protein
MDKRDLTCYGTGCLLDQLSFAQEMRESPFYDSVYIYDRTVMENT